MPEPHRTPDSPMKTGNEESTPATEKDKPEINKRPIDSLVSPAERPDSSILDRLFNADRTA